MAPSGSRRSDPASLENRVRPEDNAVLAISRASKLISDARKRKEAKRKAVQDKHRKKVEDVSKRVTTLFKTRKTEVIRLQRTQWQRLEELNTRRRILEAQILKSMAFIEVQTSNMAKELDAMLLGRLEDLKKPPIPQQ